MSTAEELHPQYVVDGNGHKKAVLLPVEEYEDLLEDLSDLAVAAERRDDRRFPTSPAGHSRSSATPSDGRLCERSVDYMTKRL